MKTVLYVNYYSSPASTRMLDGVFRYAHEAKWNVRVIERESENAPAKLMDFWDPVRCIYRANDGIKPKLIKSIFKCWRIYGDKLAIGNASNCDLSIQPLPSQCAFC